MKNRENVMRVRLTFIDEILGTAAGDPDIHGTFIAKNAPRVYQSGNGEGSRGKRKADLSFIPRAGIPGQRDESGANKGGRQ